MSSTPAFLSAEYFTVQGRLMCDGERVVKLLKRALQNLAQSEKTVYSNTSAQGSRKAKQRQSGCGAAW